MSEFETKTENKLNDLQFKLDRLEIVIEDNHFRVPIQYDPSSEVLFKKKVSFPYTTTTPSGTPFDRREAVFYNGTNYFIYVYANGGWRYVQLT